MATQTAGGNMADLVQMDYRYLFEYVRRGALLPLDDWFGKTLNLDGFDQSAIDGGLVDGKLYALNIGSNSQVGIYNTQMIKDAGIDDFNPIGWTYDEMHDVAKKVTESTPDGVYGTDDLTAAYVNWEDWTQQMGKRFYNPDGTVGTTADILADYWKFWEEMRKSGLVADGETSVGQINTSMVDTGLITKISPISYDLVQPDRRHPGPDEGAGRSRHAAAQVPGATKPGQFIKPSMFMSLTRDAKDVEAAIMYMSDWVNDPEATAILGLERGIPANPNVRAALAADFTPPEKVSVAYFDSIQDKVGDLPLPAPKGHNEVRDAYMRIGTDVVLGNKGVAEAAEEFVQTGTDILERAK